MTGKGPIEEMKGLRIYKHHYRFDMIKNNEKAKYLYIYRNPEDTLLYSNRKEGYLRIAKFLGEEYYQSLVNDEELLKRIIENTSFDYMKKNLPLVHPHPKQSSEDSVKTIDFFRKGIVGDGKNKMSPDQVKKLGDLAKELMKGTEELKEWYGEE
ncbi:hypothetical protein NPIL_412881 [Nephila pilipes]|uniref:Sulfotransferase domain-containing protein n=1 Tax=Nephila pilipes TaxID=299642 RepID=A0A8X6N5W7_NEPPI|nr:hypothetical protein NPIL_412881 [Nephila pilipes]